MSGLDPGLLLSSRRVGVLPWVVAATSFLLVLAAAASIALGRTAGAIGAAAAGRVTIEVIDADAGRRTLGMDRALAVARRRADVRTMRPVPETEVARLVSPWLGGAAVSALPLPGLIDVTLVPGSDPAGLAAALRPIAGARLTAASESLRPLVRLIGAMRGLAYAIMAVATLATGLVTMLVARSAIEAHAPDVATLHDLGATDAQLAALLQRRIAREAAVGGAIGFAMATAAILIVSDRAAALGSGLIEGGGIGAIGWATTAVLPAALVALTTAATRLAVLRRLARLA